MKANEFVKKFGWVVVREIIENAPDWAFETAGINDYADKEWSENYPMGAYCKISDLKRLVESWELVESLGGLDKAEKRLIQARQEFSLLISFRNKCNELCSVYDHVLAKAIADVESCL